MLFSMYCVIGHVLCRMFYTLAVGRFSPLMLGYYILHYYNLVYATREPPKMAQFDWFAISVYWAICMI